MSKPPPTNAARPQPTNPTQRLATPQPATPTMPRPTATSLPGQHLWLARPVPPDAPGTSPANYYTYGDTLGGVYRPHHGVEFLDPTGIDLLAVGPGTVVVAGDDLTTVYGMFNDFYGNLVVLQLDQTYAGRPVYALYGHMSVVSVQPGQHVNTGDLLGQVGASGIADGAHLHFEVRLDRNDYNSTRNPALWLAPKPGTGVIAGLVQNADGSPADGLRVLAYHVDTLELLDDVFTYAKETLNPDEVLQENWALTDVPAGEYLLKVNAGGQVHSWTVQVTAGQITFVNMSLGK